LKKLKVCFIGLGSIGTRHLKNLVQLTNERGIEIEIHALRSKTKSYQYSIDYIKIKNIYKIEDLDSNYDVAFITNPTIFHLESIKLFSSIAKHLFIEKPIFPKIYNYDKIENILINPLYYVAAPMRHTNLYKNLKEILFHEKPISVKIICSSYMPGWQKDRDYKLSFRTKKNLGGGVDIDLIHEIDYMIDLFGLPKSISKKEGKYSDLEMDTIDIVTYLFEYNNFIVEMHLDYFGVFSRRQIEVFTNNDFLVGDFLENTIYRFSNKEKKTIIKNDQYYDEMDYYLNFIIGQESYNMNTASNAYKALKVVKGKK
jgi:predicted dehydrogenase